jgi:hypothetical protein
MATQTIFDSIPTKDPFHFFNGSNPNFEKVKDVLELSKSEISKASHVPLDSVRYDDKMPQGLRERMTEWAIAFALVAGHFNDLDKTILWFRVPNPLLGGISPKDMIKVGRFKKLLKFIQTSLDENKR